MAITREQILDEISNMSVLELSKMVKDIEEKFGVSAAAPVAMAQAAVAPAAEVAEEKTSFDLALASIGSSKVQVIKAVRAITGLGLKEAKDMVESAPCVVKDGLSKEDAEKFKTQLEEAGAQAELK